MAPDDPASSILTCVQIGDPTAAGFTCDNEDDAGCINTLNLLTPATSEDDIQAAVADIAGAGNNNAAAGKGKGKGKGKAGKGKAQGKLNRSGTPGQTDADLQACAASQANAGASANQANNQAGNQAEADNEAAGNEGAQASATQSVNVQSFTGDLGGPPPAVISSQADPKRNFEVDGSTFVNAGAALQRSCAVQHTACANGANSGAVDASVADCDAQQAACNAASGANAKRFVKARRAAVRPRQNQALDFNGCNLGIDFGPGNDGRKEDSFVPADKATFNHGSALNIKVISDFICQQAANKCDLGDAEVAACNDANQLAQGTAAGKAQASADAFNEALGF